MPTAVSLLQPRPRGRPPGSSSKKLKLGSADASMAGSAPSSSAKKRGRPYKHSPSGELLLALSADQPATDRVSMDIIEHECMLTSSSVVDGEEDEYWPSNSSSNGGY